MFFLWGEIRGNAQKSCCETGLGNNYGAVDSFGKCGEKRSGKATGRVSHLLRVLRPETVQEFVAEVDEAMTEACQLILRFPFTPFPGANVVDNQGLGT